MCSIDCLTGDGIEITSKYDQAVFDRKDARSDKVEKDLVYCELCGDPITTREHLLWLAKREGIKSYSNPSLYLTLLSENNLIQLESHGRADVPERSGLVKMLCPKCRHKVMVKEEYNY